MNALTLDQVLDQADQRAAIAAKPSPLACRIHADIQPVKSVLEVLEGMAEWYNGYEFLWNRGGWTGDAYIPDEYKQAMDMPARTARFNYLFGWHNNPEVVTTACVMQVARWFAGYGRNESWNTDRIYWATAQALATTLGHDLPDTEEAENIVTKYNDRSGRSFAGIVDLINTTIELVRYDSDYNVSALPERDGMGNKLDGTGEYDEDSYEETASY